MINCVQQTRGHPNACIRPTNVSTGMESCFVQKRNTHDSKSKKKQTYPWAGQECKSESRSLAPRIFKLGIRQTWLVTFTPRPLYPIESAADVQGVGGWIDQETIGKLCRWKKPLILLFMWYGVTHKAMSMFSVTQNSLFCECLLSGHDKKCEAILQEHECIRVLVQWPENDLYLRSKLIARL